MKKISSGSSKELKAFILIVIILAIIFAFNDRQESFTLSYWLSNFIKILILSAITIIVFKLGHFLAGKYFEAKIQEKVWLWKQYWITENARFPIQLKLTRNTKLKIPELPIGIIIALIVTLISNGYAYFTAISSFEIIPEKRVGRKFPELTNFETALISFFGLLANLFLLFIFKIIGISQGVFINQYFIFWNLLPLSNLSGSLIFHNSKTLYVFSLALFILSIVFINYMNIILTIILTLILAIALTVVYFYYREYKLS